MTKSELRTKYKALRMALNVTEVEELSLAIANRTLSLPIWEKNYFHIFLPIAAQHEVDTEFLLHILSGKDKNIILSKSDFSALEMTHFLLTDNTKIVKNDYGIPEPVDGIEVPANKIDVVFVPLLAFDTNGHRVGYGKGFYDKFLATCKSDTIKIGLSFFEARDNFSEVFDNDIALDYCVTPKRVYRFGQ